MKRVPDKVIYFIRHGQSEGNKKGLLQSENDPLTELGKKQIALVAQRAPSLNAEVILSSTMPRALETAKAIAETTGLQIEEKKTLEEFRVPSMLEGLAIDSPESRAFHIELYENIHNKDWHYADEENYFDCHERAAEVVEDLKNREEKTVLVVTHGAFIRFILSTMMSHGAPDPATTTRLFYFMKKENTGITKIHYHERPLAAKATNWNMTIWNDYSHLSPEHRTIM